MTICFSASDKPRWKFLSSTQKDLLLKRDVLLPLWWEDIYPGRLGIYLDL